MRRYGDPTEYFLIKNSFFLSLVTSLLFGISPSLRAFENTPVFEKKYHFMLGVSLLPTPELKADNIELDGEKVSVDGITADYELGLALNAEKYTLIPMEGEGMLYVGGGGEVSILPSKLEQGDVKIRHYLGFLNIGLLVNRMVLVYGGLGYGKLSSEPSENSKYTAGLGWQGGVKIFHQIFFAGIKYRSLGGGSEGTVSGLGKLTADTIMSSIIVDAGINF